MSFVKNTYTTLEVATLAAGTRIPTAVTVTIGTGGAAIGATSIPLTAAPIYFQAGRDITIGGQVVTVAADLPRTVGVCTLTITKPLTGALTAAQTFTVIESFSFLGGEEVNVTHSENVINVRNYRSGAWQEQIKVMTGIAMDTGGQFLSNDLAITNVVRPASNNIATEIYGALTRPNGDRYSGSWLITGYKEPAPLDNVLRAEFSMQSLGAISLPTALSLTTIAP